MACNVTLSGIARDCGINLSGVKEVFVADYNSVAGVDVSTGIMMIDNIDASAGTFKKYEPAKNTGSLTKTLTKDESTGVKYYTNEAVMQFNQMNTEKRSEIAQLDGGFLAAIVHDMNDKYWYLGKDNYVSASAVTGQTGAAMDDGNFYTLTLTDISSELPYEVTSEAVNKVI